MINSRNIVELHPRVQELCLDFIHRCKDNGIDVIITSTYRDKESQNALYALGRTLPGKRVTNAKGGQSFHNYRVAFDFVPVLHGKPLWDDLKVFEHCGQLAELSGLEWAGRWVKMKEMAHCQYTNGLTLADFQSGKTLEA